MKNTLLKYFLLSISIAFAGYIVAKGITKDNADKKLIEKLSEKSLTAENLLKISNCNLSNKFITEINTNKHVRIRRGKRRKIFIDIDNDGVADDRDL